MEKNLTHNEKVEELTRDLIKFVVERENDPGLKDSVKRHMKRKINEVVDADKEGN